MKDDRLYLIHISECIERIDSYVSGMGKEEAIAISDSYYHRFSFSACGDPGTIEESENAWYRVVHIGYAGVPITEKIKIEKRTGKVTWT